MDLIRKVSRYIARRGLFQTADGRMAKVLVGLSGGPDSVVLLHLLRRLGYDCRAVHVNFHLRGAEADRDEASATRFCEREGIPCRTEHLPAAPYAAAHCLSVEMAARELRYECFETIRRDEGLDWIAVGHHRDDNIETFFLNLLRGSGLHGLSGIRPENGRIARPLLCLSRSEILSYAESFGLPYVTDSSNLVPDVRRNRIRLQLLPLLERIVPAADQSISRSLDLLSEADEVYQATVSRELGRILAGDSVSVAGLEACEAPQGVLHAWLSPYGFNGKTVSDVWLFRHAQTGRRFTAPERELLLDRGVLRLLPLTEKEELPALQWREIPVKDQDALTLVSTDPWRATLDLEGVTLPLSVRRPLPGERFVPYGMKGSKKVVDLLTDAKWARNEKEKAVVVVDAAGRIVWLPGLRAAAPCAVSASTRHILEITLSGPAATDHHE